MKTNLLTATTFTVFALFSNMVFGQLNRFQLLPSGETEDYMKYIRKPVTVNNVNYFTGYLTLSAFKNYNTNVMYDPGNPLQKLQLRGGNILLYGTYPYADINPTSKNGAILFSDNITTQFPHGKWGIEYDDQYSSGGLNMFMPVSSLTNSRINFNLFLGNNGNIGIGTGAPSTKLEVNGDVTVSSLSNPSYLDKEEDYYVVSTDRNGKLELVNKSVYGDDLGDHAATRNLEMNGFIINNVGAIYGPAASENWGKLEIFGSNSTSSGKIEIGDGVNDAGVKILARSKTAAIQFFVGDNWAMQVNNSEVWVGNPNNQEMPVDLKVYGKIYGREVKVTLDHFYDHVFNPDYKLMPVNQLEDFVKTNKHLPDIPSEKEALENGLDVGEMNALLLKKIEELTLYIIDQQRQIDELKKSQDNQ